MNTIRRYRHTILAALLDCALMVSMAGRLNQLFLSLFHSVFSALRWLGAVVPLLATSFISLTAVSFVMSLWWSVHKRAFEEIASGKAGWKNDPRSGL